MKEFDSVWTLIPVETLDEILVPAGTIGVITDIHGDRTGVAVDVTVNGEPNQILVTIDQVEPYDD